MESIKNQLIPLLKKNWTLKGKSKIKLLLEILLPLISIGILFGILCKFFFFFFSKKSFFYFFSKIIIKNYSKKI